jgi:hypothetical protein
MLAEEATVLRVDALVAQGNAPAAAALALRFLAASPASPHGPHLRAVIEAARNP